jgi:hypothetical protein
MAQERPDGWLDEEGWPSFVQDRPLAVNDDDDALLKAKKERHNAALQELRHCYVYWLQNACRLAQVGASSERVISSRMDVENPPVDSIELYEDQLEFAKFVENQAVTLADLNRRSDNQTDLRFAKYYRLDAEVQFLSARKQAEEDADKD